MKRHLGPPLKRKKEYENFLQKHLGADSTVSGPRLEDGRWVVDVKRKHTDIVELLKEKRGNGVTEIVSKAIADSLEVMVNDEILKQYSSNQDFAKFLTKYLEGKPRWLVGV
jgi:tRNA nucleotidyltransferase (CCA-adding enzyme)